jgi:hypothetical protein
MCTANSFGWSVRVTALALALVLPTTAFAGPPESTGMPEGPQPIEIQAAPAPGPVAPPPVEPTPVETTAAPPPAAPMTVLPVAPPPPVLVQAEPTPAPVDEQAAYRKKAVPGALMTGVGFGMVGVAYFMGLAMRVFDTDPESSPAALTDDFKMPIVGPFIAAGHAETPSGRAMTMAPGLIQVVGLAVGITGVVLITKAKRERDAGRVSMGGGGLVIRF